MEHFEDLSKFIEDLPQKSAWASTPEVFLSALANISILISNSQKAYLGPYELSMMERFCEKYFTTFSRYISS